MLAKITNPQAERKVLACLFWSACFLLLLCGQRCSAPKLIHIRRILAWETSSSLRIEAELLQGDHPHPRLSVGLWEAPEKRLDQKQLTLSLHDTQTQQTKTMHLLSPTTAEHQLWGQAQKIAQQRWGTWKGRKLRWKWLAPLQNAQPLRKVRIPLQLSSLGKELPILQPYLSPPPEVSIQLRSPQNDAPHLALYLGKHHIRPITGALARPQDAFWRRLTCHRSWCLIELDYGSAQQGHWTTQRYLFPHKIHLAQLFHMRGYQAHDQKHYRKAVRDFTLSTLLDPKYLDAQYNLACALSLLKQYPQAIARLKPLLRRPTYHTLACKDADFALMRQIAAYASALSCASPSTPPSTSPPRPKTAPQRPRKL